MGAHTLGRFEILEQLGCSDLVTVYKAHDPRSERTVVLRAMRLDAAEPQSAVRLARFREEAARAATLESPSIVELYETGEADGFFYVAMEFVSGSRLRDLQKPLSISDLLDISRQACTALDHAHAHAVIASNLKPANIMVEWDGAVKLMDFGIGESTGVDADEVLAYLSPEQISGEAPGVRSNLFSWAAILYEVATGQRAFAGEGDAVTRAILQDQPKRPVELNGELPEGISQAILKGLSKSPADRYGSGAEMLRDLENYKAAGRASAPVLPFVLQAQVRDGGMSPLVEVQDAIRPSPRIAAAKLTPANTEPVQPGPPAPVQAHSAQVPACSDASSVPQAPSVPAIKSEQPRTPVTATPTVHNPSQPNFPQPAARLVVPARTNRPAVLSKPHSAGQNPSAGAVKIVPWSTLNTRLLVYAMAAVIVALLAFIVFGAVSSRNAKVAAAPQPVAANDPDFSQLTGAPQPIPMPATVTTFEVTPAPAKPQRRQHQAMVIAAKTAAMGEVAIQTLPAGAQVQLDGRSDVSWVTPCVISGVQPGQHALVLSKPGYAPISQAFQVMAGNRAQLSLGLAALGASLAITSNPAGAAIFVDGRDSGHVTPAQLVVSGGAHKISLQKAGYLPASTTAEIVAGQVFRFDPQLKVTGDPEEARNASKMTKLFGKGSPEGMGRLQVRTSPRGAWITLNNHILDRATPADFFLPPGSYEMKLTLTGYKDAERVITIERDSKLVVEETLQQ